MGFSFCKDSLGTLDEWRVDTGIGKVWLIETAGTFFRLGKSLIAFDAGLNLSFLLSIIVNNSPLKGKQLDKVKVCL